VQGHGRRRERHEHVSVDRVSDGEDKPAVERDRVFFAVSAIKVEPNQPGHIIRARLRRNTRGVALLHDMAILDDDQTIGEHERVERVVGDEKRCARMCLKVAVQIGSGVQAGTGIQCRERLVEQ
jgi:hypothetical protein